MCSKQYGSPGRRKVRSWIGPLLAGCLLAAVAGAGDPPDRVGGEFQIDEGPQDMYHDNPDVTVAEDGTFAVVWQSYESTGTDASFRSIQWRRFGADGAPQGSVQQVNTYTTGFQLFPGVAVQDNGDFLVVWESDGSSGADTSGTSILGQRYDGFGQALGGEFQINAVTTNNQARSTVEVLANGDLITAWTSLSSNGGDTSGSSVQAQRWDSLGAPLGAQFQVNTYTTGGQTLATVGTAPDGGFVIAWSSIGSVGSDNQADSVQAQRYDSLGQPVGGQFQVNTYTTGAQKYPGISMAQDGSFLVVWEGQGPTTGGFLGIHGQRFDAAGQPQGGEIEIAAESAQLRHPDAAAGPGGQHMVVWAGGAAGGAMDAVKAQVVGADGSLLDSDFQVDTTAYYASTPTVDSNHAGEFVVAWHNLVYPQTSGYLLINRVEGQRYVLPLFEDGFESGDTAAWSDTVP